ncbi:MAG: tRNA (adenosine(37)-N6)-threonylcarbamoyltransferase complex dimerization subunit type 1 TsaB [Ignavibacteria bacterium]|nr:MAG: tRNA (adenosine(37)-N6)-threonylcarbamoyltransferase complex dimerization subunit type 1 TsaB [Ignavibacteria bacterium]
MNNVKPILAIETSETICSAALYYSSEKYFTSAIKLKHSHSEKLFEIIEFLFRQTEINRDEISSVAVSGGPGSFTGLRIGMTAAKGIASGTGVPLVFVPTFEALAYQISSCIADNTEFIIANKVNKDEVYYSKFKIKSNSYIFVDDLTILTNEEFVDKSIGIKVFGSAFYLLKENKNHNIISSPSAEYVAEWAVKFGEKNSTFDYDYLEPIYLKNFIVKERYKK